MRRKTFWAGVLETQNLTEPGTITTELLDFQTEDLDDPAPTLVRIVGQVIVSFSRSDLLASLTPGSEAANAALGIMCQQTNTAESLDLNTEDELEDERWMWTWRTRVDAVAHAIPIWNGSAAVSYYSNWHVGDYPRVIPFDIRAQRKIEHPCILTATFSWETPSGLSDMDTGKAFWSARLLFKAS